jgi:hypothetical protein
MFDRVAACLYPHRCILEKLTAAQLIMKFLNFTEPQVSLQRSQELIKLNECTLS